MLVYVGDNFLLRSQHELLFDVLGLLVVTVIVAIPAKHQCTLIFSYLLSAMSIHSFKHSVLTLRTVFVSRLLKLLNQVMNENRTYGI
jgi:hypothetical protein